MRSGRAVIEIAKWEFSRWFKWKDQIVTVLISVAIAIAMSGGNLLVDKSDGKKAQVVVQGYELLTAPPPADSRVHLMPAEGKTEQALRAAVARREIDGLLILHSFDDAELVVYKDPLWKGDLEQYLTQERQRQKMQALKLPPAELADALAGVTLAVTFVERGKRGTSLAEKVTAGILIGLMLVGVLFSSTTQFIAITGEKQQRITELIVSAVTPQQWIDGKILGISAFAFVRTIGFVLSVLAFIGVSLYFGMGLEIPLEITNPLMLLLLVILSIGGFLFWNTFFGAMAAVINDPNTSSRSALMFVPFIAAIGFSFKALVNPDTVLMKILTVIPITSPAVLSARLVLTEVTPLEIILALLLLAFSIWLMRLIAGKVFQLGILMYGKEPSFREILHWAGRVRIRS